jgi:predicted DNA-binding transcriptional regulator AlpA
MNRRKISPLTQRDATRPHGSGHTRPRPPDIPLDRPGRLRVAHVLCLLGISHSTFYAGQKTKRYPRPDGWDGKLPFWNTETIRRFLGGEK